jgi:hypothetical protein
MKIYSIPFDPIGERREPNQIISLVIGAVRGCIKTVMKFFSGTKKCEIYHKFSICPLYIQTVHAIVLTMMQNQFHSLIAF